LYEILYREDLAPVTKLIEVKAPLVASKARAGQFVVIRVNEKGERIPLTIADFDREKGTLTLIFQEVGKTTMMLGTKRAGDYLASVVGPLGHPSEIENYGTVICVGGGVGIAPVFPIARELKQAGNKVISIIGARNKDLLFWEDRMRSVSDELVVTTDDGSYGRKALVTEPLKEMLEAGLKPARIWAIGPAIMMKFVSLTTQPFGVPTIVSLNSIMVDGTGMCGACRVSIGGQTRFVCVEGPEFDGHQVDWNLLLERQRIYVDEEKRALEHWKEHGCRCGNGC